MANRSFTETHFSLLKREVKLRCVVSVGAAGAVTLQEWIYPVFGGGVNARTYGAAPTTGGGTYPNRYAQGAEGVYSVVRTATGLWTVTLQDNYQRLVGLYGHSSLAGGLSAIDYVAENTTITNMTATNGSVVGVALLLNSVATDPASGERITLTLELQDTTGP